MAILVEFGTRGGDRIEVKVGGSGGTRYKAATEQPLTLTADPITWLIDKVQPTRGVLRIWVSAGDHVPLMRTIRPDTPSAMPPSVIVRRNGIVDFAGWLDMEGVELRDDHLKGHVVELYFGDFAPLKQRRFARRGVAPFTLLLSEAMQGLPVRYRIDTARVTAVDTSLLDDECSYYDMLELVAEATICTIRQLSGVIEITQPTYPLRQHPPVHISKLYGDDNVITSSPILNTITYRLAIPPSESKDGAVDTLTPKDVRRRGTIEYFRATPTDGQTRYKQHKGTILATRNVGHAMWRYGSEIISLIDREVKPADVTPGRWDTVLVMEGAPLSSGSNVPLKVDLMIRGGAVLADENEQREMESALSQSELGKLIYIGIALCIRLVDANGRRVASVKPIDATCTIDGPELPVKEWAYEWDKHDVNHKVHLYRPGVGGGSGYGVPQREAFVKGTMSSMKDETKFYNDWGLHGATGIPIPRPNIDGGSYHLEVTVYNSPEILPVGFYGLAKETPGKRAAEELALLTMSAYALSTQYALLVDSVTIDQPVMYSDDSDARYEVTAYLDNGVTESVTYDTRVAGVVDIPAWAYNGDEPYIGLVPLELFNNLYPVYGQRGKTYDLTLAGLTPADYYEYEQSDIAVLSGYEIDFYADHTRVHLESITPEEYDGEEV